MNTLFSRPSGALRAARRPVLLAAVVLLAACGGRDDEHAMEPAADDRAVPARALASPQAFTRYAASRPADDRADPVELDGVTPPTSETAEPDELD